MSKISFVARRQSMIFQSNHEQQFQRSETNQIFGSILVDYF